MTEDRFAIVDNDGVVTGVVLWDGVTEWTPPADASLTVPVTEDVGPGDLYDPGTGEFTPQDPIVPEDLTATVGQLVDIAIQLNLIDPTTAIGILPIDPATETTVDDTGTTVVDVAVVTELVDTAVAQGKVSGGASGVVEVPAMDAPVAVETPPQP